MHYSNGGVDMRGHKKFLALSHIVLILVSIMAIIPFWVLIMASFTEEKVATKYGYSIWPRQWSLGAYQFLLQKWELFGRAYLITIIVTVVGVVVCVLITLMFAYMLSRPGLPLRNLFSFYVVFTMLFNGGVVATYINYVTVFHVKDTLFGLILPNLLTNAFFLLMVRSFFATNIPMELIEAAKIDGASEFKIFFQVAFPLSKPIIATLGLLVGVNYWNDWQNAMYYIDDQKLFGIQSVLNMITESVKYLTLGTGANVSTIPSETARMAAAVIAIIPILIIYPIFQDYFVKGITMGAVKG